MDWFRPALSSILLLAATLSLFFFAPLQGAFAAWLQTAGGAALWAFTLLRVAVLLALGYVLSRVSVTGPPMPVALLVAGPAVLVGGFVGVYAALRPLHLVIVALLALALLGACILGAQRGTRA